MADPEKPNVLSPAENSSVVPNCIAFIDKYLLGNTALGVGGTKMQRHKVPALVSLGLAFVGLLVC